MYILCVGYSDVSRFVLVTTRLGAPCLSELSAWVSCINMVWTSLCGCSFLSSVYVIHLVVGITSLNILTFVALWWLTQWEVFLHFVWAAVVMPLGVCVNMILLTAFGRSFEKVWSQ